MIVERTPRVRRAIERALLARDRVEIAAVERLLDVLKLEARRSRARTARVRRVRRSR